MNVRVISAVLVLVVLSSCGRQLNSQSSSLVPTLAASEPESPPEPGEQVVIPVAGPRGQTTAITAGAGSVWVAAYGVSGGEGVDEGALLRIDPATDQVVATIPIGADPGWEVGGGGLTYGAGSIWVTGSGRPGGDSLQAILDRIDPKTNRVIASIPLGGSSGADVAVNSRGVWVAIHGKGEEAGQVVLVDPTTNQVAGRVALEQPYVRRIAVTEDSVIVNEYEWDKSGGPYPIFTAIDPTTLAVTGRYSGRGAPWPAAGILARGDTIYGRVGDALAPLDPVTGAPGDPRVVFADSNGPRGFIVAIGGGYWYGAYPGGNGGSPDHLTYLDAASGDVTTFGKAGGSAAVILDDTLWTMFWEGDITRTKLGP